MRNYAIILALIWGASVSAQHAKFAPYEKAVIKQGKANEPFRVLNMYERGDSLQLRKPSFPVNPLKQKALRDRMIKRLHATVTHPKHLGVGIAAPQVGIHKRIIWVQRFDKEGEPWELYFNPKIISCSGEKVAGMEGCLSIPGRSDTVFRQQQIIVAYDLITGEHVEERVEGFSSVIFQHEIDHLNGILYLDHLRKEQE